MIDQTAKILIIGCGNSILGEEMYDDGYKNIVNIDIAESVIEKMKLRINGRIGLIYETMDATEMTKLKDAEFDLVIDKGTLDAILNGENSSFIAAKLIKVCIFKKLIFKRNHNEF